VKGFQDFVKKLNVTWAQMARKSGQAVEKRKQPDDEKQKPALYVSIREDMRQDSANVTQSVFEAKGCVRGVSLNAVSAEAFQQIAKAPMVKRALTRINVALRRGLSCCTDLLAGGKRMEKSLEQNVVVAFSSETRSKRSLPKADLAAKVFGFEVYGSGEHTAEASWPAYYAVEGNPKGSSIASYGSSTPLH